MRCRRRQTEQRYELLILSVPEPGLLRQHASLAEKGSKSFHPLHEIQGQRYSGTTSLQVVDTVTQEVLGQKTNKSELSVLTRKIAEEAETLSALTDLPHDVSHVVSWQGGTGFHITVSQ